MKTIKGNTFISYKCTIVKFAYSIKSVVIWISLFSSYRSIYLSS